MLIGCLEDLAKHIGANHCTNTSVHDLLYDESKARVSFAADREGIMVQGIGVEAMGDGHFLEFPFTPRAWADTLSRATGEGVALWESWCDGQGE